MKFFKCHSQKMKDEKVICLQDKFTDIGPDVFDGFCVEYIILADTTKIIRNYAFSGIGKCNIYLPNSIEEIEALAFENINPETKFFCRKGSYAEQICLEHGLIINYDVNEIYRLVDEQKKLVEEQKKLVEDQKKLVEEQKRLVEEQKQILEKQRQEKEQQELERQAEEAKKRKIKVTIFDDKTGETVEFVPFCDLPEKSKEYVDNDDLYIYCSYINDEKKDTFITQKEYDALITEINAKKEEKQDKPSNEPIEEPKALKECPFCKKELYDGDLFCSYCGKKIINVQFCSQCGEANEAEDNFCSGCGAKL